MPSMVDSRTAAESFQASSSLGPALEICRANWSACGETDSTAVLPLRQDTATMSAADRGGLPGVEHLADLARERLRGERLLQERRAGVERDVGDHRGVGVSGYVQHAGRGP